MPVNKILLHNFLEGQDGPVARYVEQKAEEVVVGARFYAGVIMWRRPEVIFSIDYQLVGGNEAVVGIEDDGLHGYHSNERYLAEKEAREKVWLWPALQDAFD